MSFPNELPRTAVGVLISAFKGEADAGRIALAAYELVGYGLYLTLGDVKYLMNADPAILDKIQKVLALLNLDDLPKYVEVASYVAELLAAGDRYPRIAVKVAIKFGPQVAALAFKIALLLKGL